MSDIDRFFRELVAAWFQGFDDLMMREAEMSDKHRPILLDRIQRHAPCPECGALRVSYAGEILTNEAEIVGPIGLYCEACGWCENEAEEVTPWVKWLTGLSA